MMIMIVIKTFTKQLIYVDINSIDHGYLKN